MARGGRYGRLHEHQRDVDDSVDIINADIIIDAEHADDIIQILITLVPRYLFCACCPT